MDRRGTAGLLALAAVAVLWGVVATGSGTAGLLALSPVLLLLGALLLRRYPGENAIARRIARAPGRRQRRRTAAPVAPRRPRACAPSGGLLLGLRLAVRPPPGAAAHA